MVIRSPFVSLSEMLDGSAIIRLVIEHHTKRAREARQQGLFFSKLGEDGQCLIEFPLTKEIVCLRELLRKLFP